EQEPEGSDGDLIGQLEKMAMEGTVPQAPAKEPPPAAPKQSKQTVGMLVEQTLERPLRPGEVSLDELERAFRETPGPEEPKKMLTFSKPAAEKARAERRAQVQAQAQKEDREAGESKVASQSIRVNVETLENLMTMVSELVLTRNQLLEIVRRHE